MCSINNAGTFFLRRKLTPHGVEQSLLVNHLAGFLLTNLLLDVLKSNIPARIINVSSGSHRSARLDLDNLALRPFYNPIRAYANSKLANILFSYELARRLDGSETTVNAVHPGLVASNIWHSGWETLDSLFQKFMQAHRAQCGTGRRHPALSGMLTRGSRY